MHRGRAADHPARHDGSKEGTRRDSRRGPRCLGVLIAYTGYVRATATEKGFDFYAHEPVFWLKICLVGIFGAGRSRLYVAQRRGLRPSLAQCFISKCLLLCPLGLLAERCHRG